MTKTTNPNLRKRKAIPILVRSTEVHKEPVVEKVSLKDKITEIQKKIHEGLNFK